MILQARETTPLVVRKFEGCELAQLEREDLLELLRIRSVSDRLRLAVKRELARRVSHLVSRSEAAQPAAESEE